MIIDFSLSFKDYDDILNFYGIWEYECPKCGARHSLRRHAKYFRNLVLWDTGHLLNTQMEILRLRCTSCRSTHAVLTMDMIPFHVYSVQAFLTLASLCLRQAGSVLKVAQQTGVSYQMLYAILAVFYEFYARLSLLLRKGGLWLHAVQPLSSEILPLLCAKPPPWLQNEFFTEHHTPLFLHRKSTSSFPFFYGAKLCKDPITHIAFA